MRTTFVVVCLLLTLLPACQQQKQAYRVVSEATLKPGEPVPPPTGEVVLSVKGKIKTTNVDDRLDFDLATLERLGLIEYAIDDPEYKRSVTLRGPLLQSVLDIAQLDPEAKELVASALNRYKTIIPRDVTRWPVIIATYRDGQRLPVAEKGPIQIAFPNRSFDIDPATYNPMYVWHLRELEVR